MKKNIKVPLPLNISIQNLIYFEPYTNFKQPTLKVLNVEDVFVTFTGLALDKEGIIKEAYHDYPDQHEICSAEVSYQLRNSENYPDNMLVLEDDKKYLLIHHPWYNYYHWLIEAIPRLLLVEETINDMVLLLPEYYQQSDFIMGSLKPFKIKTIFFIPKDKNLFIKQLCIPQIKPICDCYDKAALLTLRNRYLNYSKPNSQDDIKLGERIYLSRKKAARKKVTNEDKIEEILKKYNFTIICNEDYSFLEQVRIYSNAKYLVSIHGSGLTNMLFMKEDSAIFELHKIKTNTLDRPRFVFWYQAATLGFNYFHQICKPLTDGDYFFDDFEIEPQLFEKNINQMLLH